MTRRARTRLLLAAYRHALRARLRRGAAPGRSNGRYGRW
jgi:hypothetical protein